MCRFAQVDYTCLLPLSMLLAWSARQNDSLGAGVPGDRGCSVKPLSQTLPKSGQHNWTNFGHWVWFVKDDPATAFAEYYG
jgi:hypothetical protein